MDSTDYPNIISMKTQHFVKKSHAQWKNEYSQCAKADATARYYINNILGLFSQKLIKNDSVVTLLHCS